MAYLEISARLTGKSYRLHQELRRSLNENPKRPHVFVSPNERMAEAALGLAPLQAVVVSASKLKWTLERLGLKSKSCIFFFDDFDFFPKDFDMPIREDAYYATTPRFLRNKTAPAKGDALLTLVERFPEVLVSKKNLKHGKALKALSPTLTASDSSYVKEVLGRYRRSFDI